MKIELHLGLAVSADDDAQMNKYPIETIKIDEENYNHIINARHNLRGFVEVSNVDVYNEALTLAEKGVVPDEWEIKCLGPHRYIQYKRKDAKWGDIISELTSMVSGVNTDENILYVAPNEMLYTPFNAYDINYIKLGSLVINSFDELPFTVYAGTNAIDLLTDIHVNGMDYTGTTSVTSTAFGNLIEKIDIFKRMLFDNDNLFIYVNTNIGDKV